MAGATVSATAPAIFSDPAIEARVDSIVSRMSLDDKVGQMCQLTVERLRDFSKGTPDVFHFDEALLDSAVVRYRVGSVLNVPADVAQTPEEWNRVIGHIQDATLAAQGIPSVYGVDQMHGTTYTLGGTLFPQQVNIGASFNRQLARRAAEICAYESKACGIPWIFAPVADLGRDCRWSRMWENYGEDCYLNAQMATEAVRGLQGSDPNHIGPNNAAACMKHYMGYGVPVSGKDRTPAVISPSDLREKHFAPYLDMVRRGNALSVMISSSSINGTPTHANYDLITRWLKEDLNWDGMVVTDWGDIDFLWNRDRVAANKKDAIALAINAGIDMSMDPFDTQFCTLLKELVAEGRVPMERIDDAVRRIIRFKLRAGLFDRPMTVRADYPDFGSKQHKADALEAALQSIVLLKNDNATLPLKKGTRILVTGPNANSMRTLNGGWSYSWQGHRADDFLPGRNTILEALTNEFGKKNVSYVPGVTYKQGGLWWEENEPDIAPAVKAAADADVIVACIGENSYAETPGNLTDLTLSASQRQLVKELAVTGKPIVLVLTEGRPRIIADIEPLASAVVDAILPGDFGGDALARLLAGRSDFSAKLPFTYPKEINSITTYDYKPSEHIGKEMEGAYNYNALVSQQWPFGYGLSYNKYDYSDFHIDHDKFAPGDTLTLSVTVTNRGSMPGMEPVLLFSRDMVASVTPDIRRLRTFEKVSLKPGESKTVTFRLPASDLAFVDAAGRWLLEPGEFSFMCGPLSTQATCTAPRRWDTPNREP